MKIFEFMAHLRARNAALYYFGWANVILFAGCFISYFVNPVIITGVNGWIKPMKFAITVTIYMWTFAWLLGYLKSERKIKMISWGILICMLAENAIITLQAARGVSSHFNVHTALDGMLFSVMGAFIGINSILNLYVLYLFFTKETTLTGHRLASLRGGLLLFFLGGISGGLMVGHLAHTYGAPDGGPGLPILNWSTVAGDMRVVHFFTLHGLQVIPLFGWWVAEKLKSPGVATILFSALYLLIAFTLHMAVLMGKPVV